MSQFIDITPTWAELLPTWLLIAEDAYCSRKLESIDNFAAEMTRMAKAADRWNAFTKAQPEAAKAFIAEAGQQPAASS